MCVNEIASKYFLGIVFAGIGIGFSVLGLTVIPVFGFIPAVASFLAAAYFIAVKLNSECRIAPASVTSNQRDNE
jgi:hypothetical protein